jgi:membrane-associated phospholipid phosphatase
VHLAGFARISRISNQGPLWFTTLEIAMRMTHPSHQLATVAGMEGPPAMLWLLVIGTAYLSTYWLSNWLTHLREDVGTGVFAWERAIPFVEWTIVPYLSIVLFFIASFFVGRQRGDYRTELRNHVMRLTMVLVISLVFFALMPLRYTFERPMTTGVTGLLFEALHAFDMPYNRAPSLHISVLVILWARFAGCVLGWLRGALALWLVLIGVSVLTTYQHHVIDVIGGILAGYFCLWTTNPLVYVVPLFGRRQMKVY